MNDERIVSWFQYCLHCFWYYVSEVLTWMATRLMDLRYHAENASESAWARAIDWKEPL